MVDKEVKVLSKTKPTLISAGMRFQFVNKKGRLDYFKVLEVDEKNDAIKILHSSNEEFIKQLSRVQAQIEKSNLLEYKTV